MRFQLISCFLQLGLTDFAQNKRVFPAKDSTTLCTIQVYRSLSRSIRVYGNAVVDPRRGIYVPFSLKKLGTQEIFQKISIKEFFRLRWASIKKLSIQEIISFLFQKRCIYEIFQEILVKEEIFVCSAAKMPLKKYFAYPNTKSQIRLSGSLN